MNSVELQNTEILDNYNDDPDVKGSFNKQYHPAFCVAMKMELREEEGHMLFEDEFLLNTKPNSMDFLAVNLDENIKVKSGLGAIFKKYNMFEFKSYADSLNARVYYRTMGYMNLFIAYNDNDISMGEITVSFLRESYPRKLMGYFKNNEFTITEYEKGIYHVRKPGHIDMQIIVTRRLGDSYPWLKMITKKLKREDVLRIRDEVAKLHEKIDLVNAESVIDFSISLNKDKDFIKEMVGMGALRDLFKEEFDKKITELKEQIQNKDEQLQNKDEQLQSVEQELRIEKEKNAKLIQENEILKKYKGNKIAML